MTTFTADDFAKANLATKGRFGVARRTDPRDMHQWNAYGDEQGWFSDEEMARDGWLPVMEDAAHDLVATLLNMKETHERVIAELRHDLKVARDEMVDLREENDRLERILQTPLSLKDLGVAWEAAEVPTAENPIRGGDVIIYQHDGGQWSVREVEPHEHDDDDWSCAVRILSRAPRREPWQDLADLLGHDVSAKQAEQMARRLHMVGVRVTGGDEK